MSIENKKELFATLSKDVKFEISDEQYDKLVSNFYNADFIRIKDESEEVDKKVKKFIRKTGIVKDDKFYQLFYVFIISFGNKDFRFIMMNSEINKFLDVMKSFIKEEAEFISEEIIKIFDDFKFINKTYLEDYKVFSYKCELVKLLEKFELCHCVYKSFKYIDNPPESKFVVLKNEEYDALNVNNSKLNIVTNFLYMLSDLKILKKFN